MENKNYTVNLNTLQNLIDVLEASYVKKPDEEMKKIITKELAEIEEDIDIAFNERDTIKLIAFENLKTCMIEQLKEIEDREL
ncbi:MAG: hypothetical protein WC141_01535 [Arcobacteraceae bacterium]